MYIDEHMNEATLINRATAALERLGLKVLVARQPKGAAKVQADGWLRIAKGRERIDYVVEAKRGITPATLGATVTQLRHTAEVTGTPALFIAPYITPPMAERLREQRQQFADVAGNAYLDAPNLMIYVIGQKPVIRETTVRADKAFTANGLKVLFALLCNPKLVDEPYRHIATAAGVALGAIPGVIAGLADARHVWTMQKRRRLNATKRLLDEWALMYARKLYPRNLIGRYYTPTLTGWENWPVQEQDALWGGQPAGALLTGYLRPGELQIYAEKLPGVLAAKYKFTQVAQPGHTAAVDVRRKFWNFATPMLRTDVTPPVLVYADLLATGDARCLETAELVYEKHLAGLLQTQ